MKLGFVGLGKMGKAMVLRLLEKGVDVVVYNRSAEKTDSLKLETRNLKLEKNSKAGKFTATYSLSELVSNLDKPKIIWLMVPHGAAVDEMIEKLLKAGVTKNDILVDGGNSFYRDSIRRYQFLKKKGIHYLDIGTSGGLEGARNGSCMMVGGEENVYKTVEPILKLAAIKDGVAYFGPAGAGHFVKMVHNGVEYGMLQAIGEGFEILSKGMPATEPFTRGALGKGVVKPFARGTLAKSVETAKIDLHKVAFNWTRGSVVRGWLMELLEKALRTENRKHITYNIKHRVYNMEQKTKNKTEWLQDFDGRIGGGSTGEWTLQTAKELGVDVSVMEESLKARKKSFAKPTFSGKVVAALRYQFGGHTIKKQ